MERPERSEGKRNGARPSVALALAPCFCFSSLAFWVLFFCFIGCLPCFFCLLGLFRSIAGDVEFQDHTVMHEPVDGRRGRHRILEDVFPTRERQVAGQ